MEVLLLPIPLVAPLIVDTTEVRRMRQEGEKTTPTTMLLIEVASRVFRPRQAAFFILSFASQTVLLVLSPCLLFLPHSSNRATERPTSNRRRDGVLKGKMNKKEERRVSQENKRICNKPWYYTYQSRENKKKTCCLYS
jgi:hypothetical protein